MTAKDLASFHETILMTVGRDLNVPELFKIYESLPANIRAESERWGVGDSVIQGDIIAFLRGEL